MQNGITHQSGLFSMEYDSQNHDRTQSLYDNYTRTRRRYLSQTDESRDGLIPRTPSYIPQKVFRLDVGQSEDGKRNSHIENRHHQDEDNSSNYRSFKSVEDFDIQIGKDGDSSRVPRRLVE